MNNYLPTDYQAFIHTSRYARWIEDEGRRETWAETVDRYMTNVVGDKVKPEIQDEIAHAILNLEVMPSMRSLMTAGEALDRDNTAGYNCSYTPIDHPRCFDEVLYILLCGTGVGFSVEEQFVNKLQGVPHKLYESGNIISVADSKEGWANAYRQLIEQLFEGRIPKFNVSRVRPAGARLKTFGGRASGPQPLVDLFDHTIVTFQKAAGRNLTPLEVHSIMTKIGDVVVVGGVRRSAMISLSDLGDTEMREAKSGEWWKVNPHFGLANNSVAYSGRPSHKQFIEEWDALVASGSGERGIFNRKAVQDRCLADGKRDPEVLYGTNPCSEIVLAPHQFCNLTEVCVRQGDTMDAICRKIRIASILGTIQASFTHFPYLRPIWKETTEKEALLGVSMTGIMDCALTNGKHPNLASRLEMFRRIAVDTNEFYAKRLGINKAAAVTAVKPSGTVSQLCDTASGIHARYADYFIRTVRGDKKDPLTQFMMDQGIPSEDCVKDPDTTTVFSFPMKSPDGCVTRHDMTAVEQLEMWLTYQRHYTCHKPSVTIECLPEEWDEVGAFVYKHFDEMSGVSFLPRFESTYKQMPYTDCTEMEYEAAKRKMPSRIDWSKLTEYETEDTTKGSQTMACVGGVCELVDIEAA